MTVITDSYGEGSTLLTITKKSGSNVTFNTVFTTVDISGGEKGVDSTPTTRGARIKMTKPEEDTEVTLEGYAVEVGTTSTTGSGFYDLMGSQDTTQPRSLSSNHSFEEYQLVILATNDLTMTAATAQNTSGTIAQRWTYKNGHFTKLDASFTDGVWKFTLKFKVTPFSKTGTSNCVYESTDTTAQLPTVSSYT